MYSESPKSYKMESIVQECLKIKDYYETYNVNKSLIICNDPMYVFTMRLILLGDDFPVEFLNHINFMNVLQRFMNGNLRMMIMSDLIYEAIRSQHEGLFEDVSVVFLSSKTFIDKSYYTETFKDHKFISLNEV